MGWERKIKQIAREFNMDKKTVRKWCRRWNEVHQYLIELETSQNNISDSGYRKVILEVLNDSYRAGRNDKFTPEQITSLYAIACKTLDDSEEGVSCWTYKSLAEQMVADGIVENISPSSVGRFLREADLKPHKSRYWLNSPEQGTASFQEGVHNVCDIYKNAQELHDEGVHVLSIDEKTGIQALERINPTLPMQSKIEKDESEQKKEKAQSRERREHSYERHGTLTLIANFEVATGKIIEPTINETRTEKDFADHIQRVVNKDPNGKWIFIADQLNIHQSATLVEIIADHCGIDGDLGEKGKNGILKNMESRKKFLETAEHRIRFVFTPKHASWLNQIEIWFSILTRRLLRRGSFPLWSN